MDPNEIPVNDRYMLDNQSTDKYYYYPNNVWRLFLNYY